MRELPTEGHPETALTALLSQTLVAFTIEFDTYCEAQMSTGPSGPWLTSLVMYANCMRFVAEADVAIGELERLCGTKTNLHGMQRWGYLRIDADETLRATSKGRRASAVWRPSFALIEERWRERFGNAAIDELRASLCDLAREFGPEIPECMPILHYGLATKLPRVKDRPVLGDRELAGLDLPALLAKALVALAIAFEQKADISLAISANILRAIPDEGLRVRDLPRIAGVSKESIAMATGFLEKRAYAKIAPEAVGSRTRLLTLTATGRAARADYPEVLASVEAAWTERYGRAPIERLRTALRRLTEEPYGLLERANLPSSGWRSKRPPIEVLPHYPMVLHRGGFPDGS